MTSNADAHQALDLTTAILLEMEKKNLDLVLCYAALGCAFLQLHKALGDSKDDWLETTREMSQRTWENK